MFNVLNLDDSVFHWIYIKLFSLNMQCNLSLVLSENEILPKDFKEEEKKSFFIFILFCTILSCVFTFSNRLQQFRNLILA